jgi:uncharacterized protein YukE
VSNRFEITPGLLDAAAQGIARSGEDFAAAVERLRSQLLEAGSPWGDDGTGAMFGEIYTECTAVGLQALDHTAQLLGNIAARLDQMALNVLAEDEGNATEFRKIL